MPSIWAPGISCPSTSWRKAVCRRVFASFTKIRLGWIQADQVVLVEPGQSATTFLSPLSKKAKTLTVKIPLSWGDYYLVENRQHAGYDRALPDTGLLVLKVNPSADEGYGTVKIMDAAPTARHFANATYRLGAPGRDAFVDEGNRLAVIPLWEEDGNLGVLITTPDKGARAQEAVRAISRLIVARGARAPRPGLQGSLPRLRFQEGPPTGVGTKRELKQPTLPQAAGLFMREPIFEPGG